MEKCLLRIAGMGALILLFSGCSNLAGCVDNVGTTYAHLTPTGKIMMVGGTPYLQLSSQDWKRGYELTVADELPHSKPLTNKPSRLLYVKVSPKEKRLEWDRLSWSVASGERPLVAEETLRSTLPQHVGWEHYPARLYLNDPSDKDSISPAVRVQRGPSHYLAKPLVPAAFAADVVVTPCMWTGMFAYVVVTAPFDKKNWTR
ncbi:MAG: hypothetical protein PHQ12_09870 [Chthoniobacteraceae bacterium]|nr:hypothetical protein [Chthoniobacteraceae bacterium]